MCSLAIECVLYFRQPLIHLRRVARVCASPFDRISKVTFQLPSLITSPSHTISRCALLRIPPKNLFLYPLHTQYTHTHTHTHTHTNMLAGLLTRNACMHHARARARTHARTQHARARTHTHTHKGATPPQLQTFRPRCGNRKNEKGQTPRSQYSRDDPCESIHNIRRRL